MLCGASVGRSDRAQRNAQDEGSSSRDRHGQCQTQRKRVARCTAQTARPPHCRVWTALTQHLILGGEAAGAQPGRTSVASCASDVSDIMRLKAARDTSRRRALARTCSALRFGKWASEAKPAAGQLAHSAACAQVICGRERMQNEQRKSDALHASPERKAKLELSLHVLV